MINIIIIIIFIIIITLYYSLSSPSAPPKSVASSGTPPFPFALLLLLILLLLLVLLWLAAGGVVEAKAGAPTSTETGPSKSTGSAVAHNGYEKPLQSLKRKPMRDCFERTLRSYWFSGSDCTGKLMGKNRERPNGPKAY